MAVAQRSDEIASVKAEMQDEMDESWTSPQAGVAYPKEAAKGLAILMPVCCVVGGLLVGAFGFVHISGVPLWARLLVAASIGVLMGGTVALVAAPALAATRPDDPLAGERGVVVRVDGARPDVVEALIASDPIRLDRLRASDLTRLETVAVRDRSGLASLVSDVVDRSTDQTADADLQSEPMTRAGHPGDDAGPAEPPIEEHDDRR